MITQLNIRSASGDLLSLPLDDISDGILVEEIQGLDPVKATIVSSSFAGGDGTQYHSARRENRNVVLKLGIEPDYVDLSVQDVRDRLYDFLMPKSEVTLNFTLSDKPDVQVTGRVESFETDLFTQEPKVDISVICFDPDFIDPDEVTVAGNTSSSGSMTDGVIDIDYPGTVESGFVLTVNVNRTESDFTVYHEAPDGTLRSIEFAWSMLNADQVKLSTVYGDKYASLLRSGVTTQILSAVSPQSPWVELTKGPNKIRVYTTGAAIPYTITYTKRYGGL